MEPIGKTLSTYRAESSGTLARDQSLKTIGLLFDRLKAQFGVRFADLWHGAAAPVAPGEDPNAPNTVEREWMHGLAGFQKEELARGVAACSDFATRGHAPTLPEFKQLCRPCLNAEYAFWEAGDCLRQRDQGEVGDWTHPAVFFAACEMSSEVRSGDWQRWRVRWTRMLHKELALGWRTVPAPVQRLAHSAKDPSPPTQADRAHISRLSREIRATIAKREDKARADAATLREEAQGIVDAERKE